MYSKRTMKTILITLFLVLGSIFSVLTIASNVGAEPTSGVTTFYFKDILDIEAEYNSLGMSVLVSQNIPTKQNDSTYPPNLFRGLSLNTEEWLAWLALYFIDDLTSEYGDEFGDLLDGFELFFPHPLRIVETYEYNGSEAIEIDGDVTFDLFFSSKMISKLGDNDYVNIALYSLNINSFLPIPVMIKNKTAEIKHELVKNIKKQTITIESVNHILEPGDNLLFKIELISGNKTIIESLKKERPILEELGKQALDILKEIANNSGDPTFQTIIELIDEIRYMAEEFNITEDDAYNILNTIISSSLVYDSSSHPSSVTMPFQAPDENEDENTIIYFLHSGNKINEQKPTKEDFVSKDLKDYEIWNSPNFNRSKILKEATARLYIDYRDFNLLKNKIKIVLSLQYNGLDIASSEMELLKTQDFSPTSDTPMIFTFENLEDTEIVYNNHLTFTVSVSNDTDFGQGWLRSAELLYDSREYPSSLSLKFAETDHIKIDVNAYPEDKKIIPGGNVKYTLEITSDLDDEIQIIETSFSGEREKWEIITPEVFNISREEKKTVNITIKSIFDNIDAYGDSVLVKFSITGKTGKETFLANAEVSEDAVDYEIHIIKPTGKKIKHGNNDTYHFKIKNLNSGYWPDSYTIEASSENNWTVELQPTVIDNLKANEEKNINVTLHVPKDTNIEYDELTLIVISQNGDIKRNANVTTTVIGTNTIEGIYNFFESVAEDLGLNEIFGTYAPHFLAVLIFISAFIILIILVLIITSKSIEIICFERIKEISPERNAIYEITIKNPTKKRHKYSIYHQGNIESSKWDILLDIKSIILESNQSKKLFLTVKPTDLINTNDWIEIDVIVKMEGRRRIQKVTTMTIIKDSKERLTISGVGHWPRFFKEGEKVRTSFKVENKGNASSNNIDIILYINGKEKNKVGDITIPAGGYADIEMPWIAVKGKNEINIVVK
jgi:hypothetical protein